MVHIFYETLMLKDNSIILKEKVWEINGSKPVLFTVMP